MITFCALSIWKRLQDSIVLFKALLKESFETYINIKALRMVFDRGFQMAREHIAMSDFDYVI